MQHHTRNSIIITVAIQLVLLAFIWQVVSNSKEAVSGTAVVLAGIGVPVASIFITLLVALVGNFTATALLKRSLWISLIVVIIFWIAVALAAIIIKNVDKKISEKEISKVEASHLELRRSRSIALASKIEGASFMWVDSMQSLRMQVGANPAFFLYHDVYSQRVFIEEDLPGNPRQPDSSFLVSKLTYYGNLFLNATAIVQMDAKLQAGDVCTSETGTWYELTIPCLSGIINGGVAKHTERHYLQVVINDANSLLPEPEKSFPR